MLISTPSPTNPSNHLDSAIQMAKIIKVPMYMTISTKTLCFLYWVLSNKEHMK